MLEERPQNYYNYFGYLSIAFWSFTVILSRTIAQDIGKFRGGALVFLTGAFVYFVVQKIRHKHTAKQELQLMFSLNKNYLLFGCLTFVLYSIFLYLAIGLAPNKESVIVTGLLNYLWPSCIFIFSIPVLGNKAKWYLLIPGILISFLGVIIASTNGEISIQQALGDGKSIIIPYLSALGGAISWGLYTNFNRLWGEQDKNALPLFMLLSGIALYALNIFETVQPVWSIKAIVCVILMMSFPIVIANWFWDIAMRRGDAILVASASYFIPVFSTFISSLFLGVPLKLSLIIGCLMVTAGAFLSKKAFFTQEKKTL